MSDKKIVSQRLGVYEVYGTIVRGRYSKIRYGVNTETRDQVAIKSINKTRLESHGLLDDLKREIAIMKV